MRFMHPLLSHPIHFTENSIPVLVIEHPSSLSSIIMDIQSQLSGNKGECILSKEYSPISFANNALLFTNLFDFEYMEKKILNGIIGECVTIAHSEHYYTQTKALQINIQEYVHAITQEFVTPLMYETMPIETVFKACKVSVMQQYASPEEYLIEYFTLAQQYLHTSLFIVVNARSFISKKNLLSLYSTIQYKKYTVLFIESHFSERFCEQENIYIIDADLCEIHNTSKTIAVHT